MVCFGKLEAGKYDSMTINVFWLEYKNEKLTATGTIFRYLLLFALVDVATGEWATYSQMNYEYSEPLSVTSTGDITEQQLIQLRKKHMSERLPIS